MTTTAAAEDRIRDETSISKEIRMILAMTPKQEDRPLAFTRWVNEVVTASRRSGISDKRTKKAIRDISRTRYYSEYQINAALRDNE
jgi:hypothetical protein